MPIAYLTVIYPDEHLSQFQMNVTDLNDTDAILERVFAEWNHGSGRECELFRNSRVRSFSVNDVVMLNGAYYLCAPVGWTRIDEAEFLQIEKAVATHPWRLTEGAWAALLDVMRYRPVRPFAV